MGDFWYIEKVIYIRLKSMTDFTIISKFRNKNECERLVRELEARGRTCFNFCATPADADNPGADPEEQMKAFESTENFYDNDYFRHMFEKDLEGLKNAAKVIMLLPAGNSVHIEAGIAYGLGKPLVLIGRPEKPDSLYLIFKERYDTIEDFLENIEEKR
jgi:hypothetical protein